MQYEYLLMLISEKDLEKEVREAESVTKELLSGKEAVNADNIKNIISLRGRYLRNRLQRGLDINLSKIPCSTTASICGERHIGSCLSTRRIPSSNRS